MKTREQAEQRALELYPDTHISIVNQLHEVSRQAYIKGWEESQETKLREAAEKVVEANSKKITRDEISDQFTLLKQAIEELEKALK